MDAIVVKGIRTHNLKQIDLLLPHRKLYVITGVSGSGKSSLAFDTLYAEGQRRYVESLSSYARQFLERMEKPDLEEISGIPPAIAIQAKNVITNARSTVGTQTEITDYLRVLFSRVGRTYCLRCGKIVRQETPERAAKTLLEKFRSQKSILLFPIRLGKRGKAHLEEFLPELERQGFTEVWKGGPSKKGVLWVVADRLTLEERHWRRLVESLELAYQLGKGEAACQIEGKKEWIPFSDRFRCDPCGVDYREPSPNLFSFNSPLGACPTCQGFGRVITIDWDRVVPDGGKSIEKGAVEPWTKPSAHWEFLKLLRFCERKRIPVRTPWRDLSEKDRQWILQGTGRKGDDYFSVQDFFDHLETKTYKMHVRIFLARYRGYLLCETCKGSRLKAEALAVRVAEKNIAELSCLPIEAWVDFFEHLSLEPSEEKKVEPVLLEIRKRIRFLKEVGLGYLTLDRLSRTLSGGEVERIHLATSLGSSLVDTLYVLDEPSIGLHERDNELLIRLLKELRDLGNTVVVVEHDRTMIEAADEVIDLGPLGGAKGGELLFQGAVGDLRKVDRSLTGQYLSGRLGVGWKKPGVRGRAPDRPPALSGSRPGGVIEIRGASEHNLRSINVRIPLGQFVLVTGVSGSGKSTLVYDVLYQNYLRWRGRPAQDVGKVKEIRGFDRIDEMVLVDQAPIGRTPRSNPVTYLRAFDEIRKAFGTCREAREKGFDARHFSFNVEGGRCEECKGGGRIKVEMHFLADVYLPCETCGGKRFKPEVLEVRCQGKTIEEVLQMTVNEALAFFGDCPLVVDKLRILEKVGLGYLRLGQPAPTLSGGEAQRLKLAYEMSARSSERILYLFDEPTTGLHSHDISFLMGTFEELLARGHSLVVIEHNLEVIQCADWIVDLGPEGGEAGGRVVYAGPRQEILKSNLSHTGRYLQKYLARV